MTGPAVIESDDPLEQLLKMKKKPQAATAPKATTQEVDPLDALLATKKPTGHNGVPFVEAGHMDRMGDLMAASQGAAGGFTGILGTLAGRHPEVLANLARDIPGVEALQAGARSIFRHQSYREARDDIRGSESALPAAVRIPTRLAGGTVAAMAMPGSIGRMAIGPMGQGALFGAASGLLDSDPDLGLAGRGKSAVVNGVVGAAAGKLVDVGVTAAKGLVAPTLSKAMQARSTARADAVRPLYGAAKIEGKAATSVAVPQAVTDALNKPDIKPFADMIRNSRQFANADEATILRATYRLMGKQQGGLLRRLKQSGFDAEAATKSESIRLAKGELASAADQVMPTFRDANQMNAQHMNESGILKNTAESINRIATKAKVAPRNAVRNSPEALKSAIATMTPAEATAGLEGAYGMLNDNMRFGPEPNLISGLGAAKLFGVAPAIAKANRVSPFVKALEERAGQTMGRGVSTGVGIEATNPNWYERLLAQIRR